MIIRPPCIITPRLMAGVVVGSATISIDYAGFTPDGRGRYFYAIDHADFEYEGRDLKSGVGGGTLQQGLESLLCFLASAGAMIANAETYGNGKVDDEDAPFPDAVMLWAEEYENELTEMRFALEEEKTVIEE